MGGTGSLRTLRLSGTNGSRTLGSLIADGVSGGGGSSRRIYAYFAKNNQTVTTFYKDVFNLTYGKFKYGPRIG